MPAKLPHYLTRSRHGIYYLRYVCQGREKRKSLGTRDPAVARHASYLFGSKVNEARATMGFMKIPNLDAIATWTVRTATGVEIKTDGSPADHAQGLEALALVLGAQQLPQAGPQPSIPQSPPMAGIPAHPITLEDGIVAWMNARRSEVTYNCMEAWQTYTKRLKLEFGSDTPAHTLTPGQITDALTKMKKSRSDSTVKEYAYGWRLLFDWLVEHEHALRNPVIIPKGSTRTAKARKGEIQDHAREPWSAIDLDKIFNPDRLNALERPEMIWLPWIALFTGARREAIIHLKITDFTEYAPGQWAMRFDEKWDKTGRTHEIPVPSALIELGLIHYLNDVESMRLGSDLFPHVPHADRGRSHYFGTRFSEDKKGLGCSPNVDFHAFRTTLISILATNNCAPIPERLYTGHEAGTLNDVHQKHYTMTDKIRKWTPAEIAEAVFPCLDFTVLGWKLPDWKYQLGSGATQIKRLMKKQSARLE
jgi:integrase